MPAEIFIETDRLYLRQWAEKDKQEYARLNANPEVMEFFPSVLTAVQSHEQLERLSNDIRRRGYGFFALERKSDGAFLGFTGISHPGFEAPFTPCIEIGWRIDKPYWGNGYATEAAIASLAYAFEWIGVKEVVSSTSIHNQRSEKVMKKIGMKKENEFNHPLLPDGHSLQKHVLYKIARHLL